MRLLLSATLTITGIAPALHAQKHFGALPVPSQVPRFEAQSGQLELSGRLIVRPWQSPDLLRQGVSANQVELRVRLARDRVRVLAERYYPEVDEYVVPVPRDLADEEAAAALLATGDYQYAEPDWVVYPLDVPNDPLYLQQWHWPKMNGPAAWDLHSGTDIVIAICDTGVSSQHQDLMRVPGYNVVDGSTNTEDINGHGTMCAGFAGARGNNDTGVVGAGLGLRIMPVRVTNSPLGFSNISYLTEGARWGATHGARACSVSYAGVTSASVQTTGEYLKTQGALLVWAAGNTGQRITGGDWPDVLIVGATGPDDSRAFFSSYGTLVDLVAPGLDVLSTARPNTYARASGTSFSTPIVAGALGLIFSIRPSMTADQAEATLLGSCEDLGSAGEDSMFGHGRLNLKKAAQGAMAVSDDLYTSRGQVLGDGAGIYARPVIVGDVNGDGRDDLVFSFLTNGALTVRTKFSNGDGTWTETAQTLSDGSIVFTHPTLHGDVNGDGRMDLVFLVSGLTGAPGLTIRTKLSNGDGTWTKSHQYTGDGSGVFQYPALAGDVNGDGRADIVFVGRNWNGTSGLNVRVKLSHVDGTWTSHTQVLGDGNGVFTYPTMTGDVDGDGRMDLVFVGIGWNGTSGFNVRVKLSNGNGTWTPSSQAFSDGAGVLTRAPHMADVDGDGRDDILLMGQDFGTTSGLTLRVKRSLGNGTFESFGELLGDGPSVNEHEAVIGDVDGDGRSDLIFVGYGWGGPGLDVHVKKPGIGQSWTSVQQHFTDGSGVFQHPTLQGDIDGDGRSDLIFVGQDWSGAGLNVRVKFSAALPSSP